MSLIYNYTELRNGTNIVDWLVIMNGWSNGILFNALFVTIFILIFSVARWQDVEFESALILTGFAGFLISIFAWLIRFNGVGLVDGSLPIVMAILTGIGLILKMTSGWLK